MERAEIQCKICNKSLKSSKALRDHSFSKNHYPYRCGFCQKGFTTFQAQHEHEQAKHSVLTAEPSGTKKPSDLAPDVKDVLPKVSSEAVTLPRTWDIFKILSEREKLTVYDTLCRACHGRQLLESQGYILPGCNSTTIEETVSVPYGAFRQSPRPVLRETRKAVALHCESVLIKNNRPRVARVSAIDVLSGDTLLDVYVNPSRKVIDWRSDITGINSSKMHRAVRGRKTLNGWRHARQLLFSLIDRNTILVGHELQHSLGVLGIFHERIIDTAIITSRANFGKDTTWFPITLSLEEISSTFFHKKMCAVNNGYRNCIERARVAREIALCSQDGFFLDFWDAVTRQQHQSQQQIRVEVIKMKINQLLTEHRQASKAKVGILIEGLES